MPSIHSILASDDETLIKFVGAILVLIIWGISSLISAMGKSRQKALKQQQQNRIAMTAAPKPTPPRQMIPPRIPAALPPLAPRMAAPLPPLATLAAQQRQARPAIAKAATRPKASTPRPAPAPASPPMQPSRVKAQVAPAAITNLLRPKTVRAQFILAEVLQPPLALRTRKSF